ncbi:phosphoribosyl-AMP cyclohydrolase [Aquidulcibacter paucihalophilus]|uniref:phosphoribosyl-AMP cyclohydrolase n=1 Tax=Aquidulcibacter paucihalophilus TaxID=1978549 RepID=UPI0022B778B5|nr:phosphoribosyl-AMP cyclohydrolase [Aquidulcibacter paucihalophilus]
MAASTSFPQAGSTQALERGLDLMPRFDADGLIPAVAQSAETGEVLMLAWMNAEALRLTLETGIAHYWSRSRQSLWKKGETSGQLQHVQELRIDCDQDAVVMKVKVDGDGGCCHVGFQSCFYRAVVDKDGRLVQIQPDPAC